MSWFDFDSTLFNIPQICTSSVLFEHIERLNKGWQWTLPCCSNSLRAKEECPLALRGLERTGYGFLWFLFKAWKRWHSKKLRCSWWFGVFLLSLCCVPKSRDYCEKINGFYRADWEPWEPKETQIWNGGLVKDFQEARPGCEYTDDNLTAWLNLGSLVIWEVYIRSLIKHHIGKIVQLLHTGNPVGPGLLMS